VFPPRPDQRRRSIPSSLPSFLDPLGVETPVLLFFLSSLHSVLGCMGTAYVDFLPSPPLPSPRWCSPPLQVLDRYRTPLPSGLSRGIKQISSALFSPFSSLSPHARRSGGRSFPINQERTRSFSFFPTIWRLAGGSSRLPFSFSVRNATGHNVPPGADSIKHFPSFLD